MQNRVITDSHMDTTVKMNDNKTGKCAYLITFSGLIQVSLDMRPFPFDDAIVSVAISCDAAGQSSTELVPKVSVAKFASNLMLTEWSIGGNPSEVGAEFSIDPRMRRVHIYLIDA